MTHKWLKKNDPITYYELTSNPTGVDSDDSLFGCFCTLVILGIIGGIIYYITLWK